MPIFDDVGNAIGSMFAELGGSLEGLVGALPQIIGAILFVVILIYFFDQVLGS